MITRDDIKKMILSEVAQARKEISSAPKTRLTRERIHEIVLEEASALLNHGQAQTTQRFSLAEAILGSEDEATGMIYSGRDNTCEGCGAMYEMPMAKCQHCGASMKEYVARGISNMGKLKGVYEAKRKKKTMKSPMPDVDLSGMSRDTAKSMVAKISRAPGPTFSNIMDTAKDLGAENPVAYAGTLMRSASQKTASSTKHKGKKSR
jgi:hypothetical protein